MNKLIADEHGHRECCRVFWKLTVFKQPRTRGIVLEWWNVKKGVFRLCILKSIEICYSWGVQIRWGEKAPFVQYIKVPVSLYSVQGNPKRTFRSLLVLTKLTTVIMVTSRAVARMWKSVIKLNCFVLNGSVHLVRSNWRVRAFGRELLWLHHPFKDYWFTLVGKGEIGSTLSGIASRLGKT